MSVRYSSWVVLAFAYDLLAAREAFTAHVRKEVRPRVEALAKNRHFFAAEAIEAIFMQLFLVEVRKRIETPFGCMMDCGLDVKSGSLHCREPCQTTPLPPLYLRQQPVCDR